MNNENGLIIPDLGDRGFKRARACPMKIPQFETGRVLKY
jgi:hypothetical protein